MLSLNALSLHITLVFEQQSIRGPCSTLLLGLSLNNLRMIYYLKGKDSNSVLELKVSQLISGAYLNNGKSSDTITIFSQHRIIRIQILLRES